jgi:two-component system, LytTR family, sensor kinase
VTAIFGAVRGVVIVVALAAAVAGPVAALWLGLGRRRAFGTVAEQAAYEVLHLANEAAPPFRSGLTVEAAGRAVRSLRRLLGSEALAITDRGVVLAWDGGGEHHRFELLSMARPVLDGGSPVILEPSDLGCGEADCPVRAGIVVPIESDGAVVGTLATFGSTVRAGTARAAAEVAAWVATQVELGRLDQTEARAASAELRALRAQISPHFVYNALTAISSLVRTEPERARELLGEFADFTRYSFRRQGEFTTLADELRAIDAYLQLERARFGDRLQVRLRVAPEVLPVVVPFLVLQPLIENAVRHGIEGQAGPGEIVIEAQDAGTECRITVEDNGVGMDPDELRNHLAGRGGGDGIGLANIDERMRAVFGDSFGIVVETAVAAGTKVSLRVPKYRAGVRAS